MDANWYSSVKSEIVFLRKFISCHSVAYLYLYLICILIERINVFRNIVAEGCVWVCFDFHHKLGAFSVFFTY